MCEDCEVTVNCQHDTREIVNCLDRLVSAMERIAKGVECLPAFAGVTHFVPAGETVPPVVGEDAPQEGDDLPTLAATIPDTVLPKASDYTDAQRGAIIAELDALGVDYKARARTNTLHTALIEARDMKTVEAKMDAEAAETPDAVDLAEYRGRVRGKLIDYAYEHGNDKAREMVRAYGEDKKVGDLTLEQLEEIERKLADADEN